MAHAKSQNQTVRTVFMYLSMIVALVLFVVGGLAFWAHSFASNMVRDELVAQKIYFPQKGSPALDPKTYPDLQQYAGQIVDTPEKARAYADGYIGRHLEQIAGGKTYAEISAESTKNPTDQKLQQQKQTLFQGETLRVLLLTSGYGLGLIGKLAGIAAYVLLASGAVMLCVAAILRIKKA